MVPVLGVREMRTFGNQFQRSRVIVIVVVMPRINWEYISPTLQVSDLFSQVDNFTDKKNTVDMHGSCY